MFLFLSRSNVLRSHGVEKIYRVADEIQYKLATVKKTWISSNDLEQVGEKIRVVLFIFVVMRQQVTSLNSLELQVLENSNLKKVFDIVCTLQAEEATKFSSL